MAGDVTPSSWAVEQFGEHAATVMKCVAGGLQRAQLAARRVQLAADAEGGTTRRPYGSMWETRYTFVVDHFKLANVPGYQPYRPFGASYHLAVINGRVLIPFRFANNLHTPPSQARITTQIPQAEGRRQGVKPSPSLFDEFPVGGDADADVTVAEAVADARAENLHVIYIAFAANADSDDVLGAWWGEPIALEDDGSLIWTPEKLDLTIATPTSDVRTTGDLQVAGTTPSMPGFTQGAEPALTFFTRSQRLDTPTSEAEPITPDAENGDE